MPTIKGNNRKNNLVGTNGNDAILGLGGNDVLLGKGGNDVIKGGTGNDILDGGNGNDKLFGDAGNDLLRGGIGADKLVGGAGVDTADYSASDGQIQVQLALLSLDGNGNLVETVGSRTLGAHASGDVLIGIESIIGSAFNDALFGKSGSNGIAGGAGDDEIAGLSGVDFLIGGAGSDKFFYFTVGESGVGAGQRDFIADFVQGQDQIDLSQIDANLSLASNQAFFFIGFVPFGLNLDNVPQVGFFHENGNTIVHVDRAGDGNVTADFEIQLNGIINLTASDFIL